jgi:hypothetical protein
MNYDATTGKAREPFQSIFKEEGMVFGCENCFAYAGVSFKFRAAMYVGVTGIYVKYVELELTGKLMSNFNLVAIVQTPKSSTKMMYQTDDKLKIVNDVFKSGISKFTDSVTFDSSEIHLPFPEDAKVLLTIQLGSVKLEAKMALVVDIDVTGSNTFTAQAGAYANAKTRVALYVFEKGKCEYPGVTETEMVHDKEECKKVLVDAGITEAKMNACEAPDSTAISSGKCFSGKYLVIQVFEKPTFRSGLNGPSIQAANDKDLSITISIYPIARISAFAGVFSLYLVPELKAVVKASSSASKCAPGVEISVSIGYVASVRVRRLLSLNPFTGPGPHLASNLWLV